MTEQPATFDVTIKYGYTKSVIPPRCRKPRDEQFTDTLTVHVPVLTSEQAPVAIRLPWDAHGTNPSVVELRGYKGDLYEPKRAKGDYSNADYTREAVVDAGAPDFPSVVQDTYAYGTQSQRQAQVLQEWSGHLVIDGKVWVRTDEPTYEVMTFGMGSNHGGTSLFITRYVRNEDTTHPATDRDAAIKHAVQVATDRGDTESIETIRAVPTIEVLNPQYIKRASLADVKADREVTLLAKIAAVKQILDETSDGRDWYERIDAAQDALKDALALARRL